MKRTLALLFSLLCVAASAQEYRYVAFSRTGTAELRGLRIGSRIDSMMESYGNEWCAWATSTLPTEGIPPAKPASFAEPEDEWSYLEKLSDWETMYAADRAFDGDPATAWCEGSDGEGPGEALALPIEPEEPYLIFSGFGKSKDYWLKNARPKALRLTILEAGPRTGATQHGTMLTDLRAVAQSDFSLADSFGYQELKLPRGKFAKDRSHVLVIEILSVYPGSKYKDCLISEVLAKGKG